MDLTRTIRSALMRRFADPALRERRRAAAERHRRRQGRPHEVLYFHQVDDPYSQLAAQALKPLLARYDIALRPKVVAAPTPIAIHAQDLWDRWAESDCGAIAPYYGLEFAKSAGPPDAASTQAARALAVSRQDAADFADTAMALTRALRAADRASLSRLCAGLPERADADKVLADNFRLRHRLGHYLGAMFHYEGEWYWGVDRLHYLEARLDALGARRRDAPPGPSVQLTRRAPERIEGATRLKLEFFASLRSPYTQLAYARVADLCRRYPLDLTTRPVIPMMMRGVKADRRKGMYILRDAQREAERLGVPFGNIWDPFGAPVLRAYSLFPWARERGREFAYMKEYSYAVWGERVDAGTEAGLRTIVERAGLDWNEARQRLDNRDWEAGIEGNVRDMIAAGSWGVPTFRLSGPQGAGDFTVWGQDRLWLIEEEIARRLGQ